MQAAQSFSMSQTKQPNQEIEKLIATIAQLNQEIQFLKNALSRHEKPNEVKIEGAVDGAAPSYTTYHLYGEAKPPINLEEVVHIQTSVGGTHWVISGKKHITLLSFSNSKAVLPAHLFLQVSRWDIVNLSNVVGLKGNMVLLDNDTKVEIGRKYAKEVKVLIKARL
jgi:DNA-binding LytR/AlgR family response regulator